MSGQNRVRGRPRLAFSGGTQRARFSRLKQRTSFSRLPCTAVGRVSEAGKSSKPPVAAPDKLAVGLGEAAALLSASDDHFREHIKPELRIVRRGKRQFVAIRELERWLSESSAPT